MLSSGPAYAEWVAIGTTDAGMTIYFDPDTIRRKGYLVKMWSLMDYETTRGVTGSSYLSSNEQREYDGTEERGRILAFTNFSGNMGTGKIVYTFADEQ